MQIIQDLPNYSCKIDGKDAKENYDVGETFLRTTRFLRGLGGSESLVESEVVPCGSPRRPRPETMVFFEINQLEPCLDTFVSGDRL